MGLLVRADTLSSPDGPVEHRQRLVCRKENAVVDSVRSPASAGALLGRAFFVFTILVLCSFVAVALLGSRFTAAKAVSAVLLVLAILLVGVGLAWGPCRIVRWVLVLEALQVSLVAGFWFLGFRFWFTLWEPARVVRSIEYAIVLTVILQGLMWTMVCGAAAWGWARLWARRPSGLWSHGAGGCPVGR